MLNGTIVDYTTHIYCVSWVFLQVNILTTNVCISVAVLVLKLYICNTKFNLNMLQLITLRTYNKIKQKRKHNSVCVKHNLELGV